jgi:hypothetical protein
MKEVSAITSALPQSHGFFSSISSLISFLVSLTSSAMSSQSFLRGELGELGERSSTPYPLDQVANALVLSFRGLKYLVCALLYGYRLGRNGASK